MHVPTSEMVINMVVTLPSVLATRITTRTGCVVVAVIVEVSLVAVGIVITSVADTAWTIAQ